MKSGVITDISALKDLFLSTDCSKWILYRGFHKSMPHTQILANQKEAEMEVEQAWDELEHQLKLHSGNGSGEFTIYVPAMSHNKGFSWWFQVGQSFTQPGVAGIGGYGPAAMGMIPAAQVELERMIWKMERQIEDMEAAQQAQQSIGQQVLDKVLAECDMNQVIQGVFGFLGQYAKPAGQRVPISIQGDPATVPPSPQPGTGYEYREDIIVPWLDLLRPSFNTDTEFYQFLQKLADLFLQNPERYKAMINSAV